MIHGFLLFKLRDVVISDRRLIVAGRSSFVPADPESMVVAVRYFKHVAAVTSVSCSLPPAEREGPAAEDAVSAAMLDTAIGSPSNALGRRRAIAASSRSLFVISRRQTPGGYRLYRCQGSQNTNDRRVCYHECESMTLDENNLGVSKGVDCSSCQPLLMRRLDHHFNRLVEDRTRF